MAGTGDRGLRGDDAGLEPGERDDWLECRAGRINPGRRLVDQRVALVGREFLPGRMRQPGRELHRIEARARQHREHVAIRRVEQHAGDAGLALDAAGDEFLHRDVEPENDVIAGLPRLTRQLAHDAAMRVDLDLAGAGEAAQPLVLRPLDPAPADAEIGQLEQRIAGQILIGHRRHVAQHMRGHRAIGIIPDKTLFDRHAGQFRDRDLDARHLLPAQIGAHDDRDKAVLAARLPQHAALLGLAEIDHAAKARSVSSRSPACSGTTTTR